MADFASVYNLANRPTVELQNPADLALKRQTYEAGKMAFDEARAKRAAQEEARGIYREAGGDFRKAAGLAQERGLLEHASYFGGIADKHDTEVAQAQEAASKMTAQQREDVLKRIQTVGQASKWVLSQPPERQQAAQDTMLAQLGQHIPELQQLAGKPFDPDRLHLLASQMDAFGAALAPEKPMTEIGKLNWELDHGKISQAQFDREYARINAPKTPLVQVGYSQPFEVVDPETGKSKLVQQDKAGNLREVQGYAPKSESKPLTDSQANALGFGVRAMEADQIAGGLEKNGANVSGGVQRAMSNTPLIGQYLTPKDLQQYNQAKQNFITAVLRKESGAAISAGEFTAEDQKYFPQPGDTPEVIKQKARARQTAIKVLETAAGRPLNSLDTNTPVTPKPVKVWTVKDDNDYAALPPGAHFKGPDGIERVK